MDTSHIRYLLLGLAVVGVFSQQTPAECTNYKTIQNVKGRSALDKVTSDHQTLICDSAVTYGWYRILPFSDSVTHESSGFAADISWTKPQSDNRCRTKRPIYIKADTNPLPTIKYATKEVSLCMYLNPFIPCLSTNDFTAKITNCGSYNVYYLSKTPGNCPEAYCLDERHRCPPGTKSHDGFSPCTGTETKFYKGKPIVSYSVNKARNELIFHCDTTSLGVIVPEHRRRVRWFMSRASDLSAKSYLVHEEIGEPKKLTHRLEEQHWNKQITLGSNIWCEVSAYATGSPGKGQSATSDKFYAGLKVDNSTVVMRGDGSPANITVFATVPILCSKSFISNGKCQSKLNLRLHTRDEKSPACSPGQKPGANIMIDSSKCGIQIPGLVAASHRGALPRQSAVVKVVGRSTDLFKGDGLSSVRLSVTDEEKATAKTAKTAFSHWKQKIPDINVKVTNDNAVVAGKICYSINDPHMRTFMEKQYEMHAVGTFILYKHERLPIQVQARYEVCGKRSMTCNCGIAIQSGKDVFIYDTCAKMKYDRVIRSLRVGVLGCNNEALVIDQRADNSYEITLPTGTRINLAAPQGSGPLSLTIPSIYITASPQDVGFGTVGGLCGVISSSAPLGFKMKGQALPINNGTKSWRDAFSKSWKVEWEDSLFDNVAGASQKLRYNLPNQCVCKSVNGPTPVVFCDDDYSGTRCAPSHEENLLTICKDSNRKKREELRDAADLDIFSEKFEYVNTTSTGQLDWSWENGWTAKKAEMYCSEQITKHVPGDCLKLSNVDMDFFLNSCVTDIRGTGGTYFTLTHIQGVSDSCMNEISVNTTLWINGAPPTNITDSLCPAVCSLRGTCVKGVCVCDSGYTSADCSIDVSVKPSDIYIMNNGLCDIQQRSCHSTILYGRGFYNQNATCQLKQFLFNGVDFKPDNISYNKTFIVPATIMSIGQASCSLPSAGVLPTLPHGYEISLSNNGIDFSPPEKFILFDSTCMQFDEKTRRGHMKADTCYIDDQCYQKGYEDSTTKKSCNPTTSLSSWS